MDKTLQELLRLVDNGSVEQRCASLLVLGALKAQGPQVTTAVGAALNHTNPVLKDYALRYFEAVRSKSFVPLILRFLDDPDKETQERVVRLLSSTGQAAVDPLVKQSVSKSRAWQLNAASVFRNLRGKAAFQGLLRLLVSGTDEFNKAVCDLLTPAIRGMDTQEQKLLYAAVETFAMKLDAKQQRPAVVSALRLLGQLGFAQARRWVFKFVGPEHPASVRSHALVALLHCLRQQDLRKDEHGKLFALLEEPEFSEVTRLALELLDAHELPEDARVLLSRLMQSPHGEIQKFALRKMSAFSTPATVRTLVDQMGDPDYRRRDVAASSLRKIPEARAVLIKELLACDDASKAWSIAELLPSFEGKWRQDALESLWKRLHAALSAEERIQTAFLHVLKQADLNYTRSQLANYGARLVKAKKYKEAVAFLAPLKDFPDIEPENKFHLALAQLKLHSHTLASNRHHPAVELFADLYRNSAYPLVDALRKEKSLAPEEVFSLGFSFAERPGDERSLGRDLLAHIAGKFPRNKVGKSAKNKLRLMGA
ncbi:MAG: HEAT repeat domain-containing protein [Candidatus Binatia bacterium]